MYQQAYNSPPLYPLVPWSFSPSFFNGKEKDWESGFHYYGARYYWSELLTGWLSVDPMADEYPNISPYAYCAWNSVKLVDPDGCDTLFSFACRTKDADRNKENTNALKWFRGIGDQKDIVSIATENLSGFRYLILQLITERRK